MKAVVLYCPDLGRDIAPILRHIPDAVVLRGELVTPGEAGCLAMHQQAVRMAVANGWSAVTVIEDDCQFAEWFTYTGWIDIAARAHELGAGALVGGSVKTFGARAAGSGLVAVDRCCSAHFVTHFERGYDAVFNAVQPFDLSFSSLTPTLVAWPFVAVQAPGKSGIGRPVDPGASQRYRGPEPVDYRKSFAKQQQKLAEVAQ